MGEVGGCGVREQRQIQKWGVLLGANSEATAHLICEKVGSLNKDWWTEAGRRNRDVSWARCACVDRIV